MQHNNPDILFLLKKVSINLKLTNLFKDYYQL